MKILNSKELEKLTEYEKINYFIALKEYCTGIKHSKRNNMCSKIIYKITPCIRNYDFEIRGYENIPEDGRRLFLCNHSNAHDFFTMQETFQKIGINITFLASNEDISSIIKSIFIYCGGVLIDRKEKDSIEKGMIDFSANILCGLSGVIFGESTWNLHPYKPMLKIKAGASNIAAITDATIIPTIFEYVETSEKHMKEKNIYSKCIVQFGEPINILKNESLIMQTNILQSSMERTRMELWRNLGIVKSSLSDINQEIYLNHTYLKKFGAFGVDYDSEREMRFLFSPNGQDIENEYCIDNKGNFVPGIIQKNEKNSYLRKI